MKNKNRQKQKDSELDKIRIRFEVTRLNWLSVKGPERGQKIVTKVTLLEALIAET